jgi:hypothetical protein
MRTRLNSETEGEKWLEAGGGLPSDEALFADAAIKRINQGRRPEQGS